MDIANATLSSAVGWILASCAGFITVVKAVELLRRIFGRGRLAREMSEHAQSLRDLDKALRDQQDAQTVMFRGILSLINHQLSGNGVDKLRDARDEIQNYLTGR